MYKRDRDFGFELGSDRVEEHTLADPLAVCSGRPACCVLRHTTSSSELYLIGPCLPQPSPDHPCPCLSPSPPPFPFNSFLPDELKSTIHPAPGRQGQQLRPGAQPGAGEGVHGRAFQDLPEVLGRRPARTAGGGVFFPGLTLTPPAVHARRGQLCAKHPLTHACMLFSVPTFSSWSSVRHL